MTNRNKTNRIGRILTRGLAWVTVPLYLAGMGSIIWIESRIGMPTSLEDVTLFIGFGAFAVVGSFLVARCPTNPVSWILVASGLIVSLFPAAETYAAYRMITRGSPDLLAVFGAWANGIYWIPLLALIIIYLPLLFPDGHLPSRHWRPIAVIPGLSLAFLVIIDAFRETLEGQKMAYQINNPIGIKGLLPVETQSIFLVLAIGILIGLAGAIAAVIARFRRSIGAERQQIKWFLYAVSLTPFIMVVDYLPSILGALIFGLVIVSFPVAIGVAVLRYRLYDIDLVIRRTLVYSVLTVLLGLVYYGLVTLLQSLFVGVSRQQSPLMLVISTLAIATLFSPLRRRIQQIIDRRFFRQRYDARQALDRFGQNLRSQVELPAIEREVVEVVSKTVQPVHISLWIRKVAKG